MHAIKNSKSDILALQLIFYCSGLIYPLLLKLKAIQHLSDINKQQSYDDDINSSSDQLTTTSPAPARTAAGSI